LGTLATEFGRFADALVPAPRIYADANIPQGVVAFMRARLEWDVLFVIEHDDLRRASDEVHYRMARQLGRTLVTLDRDFVDDRRFPPDQSGGVIVCEAPDERALKRLMRRVDRALFRPDGTGGTPLVGHKVRWHPSERILKP
jgi:predicted nuclease of predicted toxin-antitoxin system